MCSTGSWVGVVLAWECTGLTVHQDDKSIWKFLLKHQKDENTTPGKVQGIQQYYNQFHCCLFWCFRRNFHIDLSSWCTVRPVHSQASTTPTQLPVEHMISAWLQSLQGDASSKKNACWRAQARLLKKIFSVKTWACVLSLYHISL